MAKVKIIISIKKLIEKLFFWCPFLLWISLTFLENILTNLNELFYLISGLLPFLSVLVFLYYLTLYIVTRSEKSRKMLISLMVISVVIYGNHWVSLGEKSNKTNTNLKVFSWNVQRLGALTVGQNSSKNLIHLSTILKASNTDIAVIQEISKKQTNKLKEYLGLTSKDIIWTNYFNGSKGGLAILLLSKNSWSISNKNITNLPPNWKCVYSELKHINGSIINLLGVHISPPKVTDYQIKNVLRKGVFGEHTGIKNLLKRYVRQARIQTQQVDKINYIISKFKDPTIIAGDFNSTSQLPIHKKLRKNFNDVWLEGGNGIGSTRNWAGILPLRIDYIYTSDDFGIIESKTRNAEFSDHNPIFTSLFLKN